jgi:hypothetical protein
VVTLAKREVAHLKKGQAVGKLVKEIMVAAKQMLGLKGIEWDSWQPGFVVPPFTPKLS